MNTEPILENEQDIAKRAESLNTKIESKAEDQEAKVFQGAEMLENPPGGDFRVALKNFIVWVKNIFAK